MSQQTPYFRGLNRRSGREAAVVILLALALLAVPVMALAQAAQQTPQQTPPQPQQQPPAEAGGPSGDIGPIAVPKKKPEEAPKEEKPKPFKNPEGMADFSIRVDVPLVTIDATVVTKDGMFVPGLKGGNFRVLEDGVPQRIVDFKQTEAPITAVLLVEFANNSYEFMYDALNASYTFASTLKPEDWIAVMSFDMRTYLLADFTQDKREVYGALRQLRIPGFSETNVFDALYETIDRLEGVEGRKYIILVSTGRDTFSKINLDHILRKVQGSRDITIYSIGTGQALLQWADARGYLHPITRMDFLQAENQLKTFARMTGGKAYFPRFEGELRGIFADIGNTIRNQYTISYRPSNTKQDGSFRKIKVELVGPNGEPLKMLNEKQKEVKYQVIAREGYKAKMEVE